MTEKENNRKKRAGVVPFCQKEGKILLMYREREGYAYYAICGGGVEKGENYRKAAKRELFEETGLKVKKLSPLFYVKIPQGDIICKDIRYKDAKYKEARYFYSLCNQTPLLAIRGEELLRSSPENVYIPSWIALKDLESLNILPFKAKEKLISFFGKYELRRKYKS